VLHSTLAVAVATLLVFADPWTATSSGGLIREAGAQQVDRVVPPGAVTGAMAPVDEAFTLYAASAALAQIEAAQWVVDSTQDARIRGYAQRVAQENARARDSLERIARAHKLKLPASPTGRHLDLLTKLRGVAAADLDDAFVRRFGIDAHKEAIALFERHLESGRSAELRRHAEQMLPAFREQVTAAQKLIHETHAR
jgi:putative membrane protein